MSSNYFNNVAYNLILYVFLLVQKGFDISPYFYINGKDFNWYILRLNIIIVAEGAIDMDGNAITCEDIKKVLFNIKV